MIYDMAFKNFIRQGMRAWLNVLVTALILIAVVFSLSLLNGFQTQALRNMASTDVAGGHYRVPGFDILEPTEWEDQTLPVPEQLAGLPHSEKAEVLVQQGQLFPNRRLFPVQLRGVEMEQTLLELPLEPLRRESPEVGSVIPVILGSKMAEKSHLAVGDVVVLKWRDRHGAVDALDVKVVDVVPLINPRIDEGVVWMRLDHLRTLTDRSGEVTWVAVKDPMGAIAGFEFQSVEMLMHDLMTLLRHDRRNTRILWFILISLAGISVFNTQILSVFKRQKEIGTLLALGMTPQRVVRLFTLEGSFAAFLAVVAAVILGVPFFIWFQGVGFDVSHLSETGFPVREKIFLDINAWEVITSTLITVAIVIAVAWAPVKKIVRLDPTQALRGRAIT
ncbi:putative Similar to lipoprotein releasing system transmembrane protein [Nitrospina gracilis 3/211]|uniref:Putative Similar to lipoprotein releasing system transmembrane protein n=1 Tax=Nitrospina gracilis (strain 3/211) TaxID=1266370 RepID=M1ZD53_NITG3|nr:MULTISPECIES: FtsX-like permease family protein [Nitrospina]MCF8724203.1 ABC-type lipoprotein release transport system permease subunit [Nitrospina sp. Nb-3]CCQ91349.1 putative Similar to lipoprotein releasing system transmembrane protein [Nitrospina gracilis 3/211]